MDRSKIALSLAAAVLAGAFLSPLRVTAADRDPIETAGVAVGVTAGNTVAVPAKIISVGTGLIAGALSFILTGGNAELTAQIWRDITEGPYVITPSVARRAIGERPELEKRTAGTVETAPAVETNATTGVQPASADSPTAP